MSDAEMAARIEARDADRAAADAHRAFVEADRREELRALSELTEIRKAKR